MPNLERAASNLKYLGYRNFSQMETRIDFFLIVVAYFNSCAFYSHSHCVSVNIQFKYCLLQNKPSVNLAISLVYPHYSLMLFTQSTKEESALISALFSFVKGERHNRRRKWGREGGRGDQESAVVDSSFWWTLSSFLKAGLEEEI